MDEFKLKKILKNQKDSSKSKKISLLLDTNNKKAVVKKNLLSFLKEIKRTQFLPSKYLRDIRKNKKQLWYRR